MNVLYIFVDESGDYDFRPGRSEYLIWGATTIIDNPYILYTPFSQLKHELNTNGIDTERFHASEESQCIRDKVFNILSNPKILFENDFVVVEKRKTNLSIRDPRILYPKMANHLLQYIFNRYNTIDKIIIFTDTLPIKKKREAIEKALKGSIRRLLGKKEFHIYHHSSQSNFGLQAIDYCVWAVFKKWERNDLRSYRRVQRKIKSEFNIFQSGTTVYY